MLLKSGGSNSPWFEFWSEFPHFMGMGVVPAPSKRFDIVVETVFEIASGLCEKVPENDFYRHQI